MPVNGSYDASFLEIFQGSAVATFLHEQKLFAVPGIQVYRFYKGIDYSILPMLPSAIQTQMYS
jgi:hypothetical protein